MRGDKTILYFAVTAYLLLGNFNSGLVTGNMSVSFVMINIKKVLPVTAYEVIILLTLFIYVLLFKKTNLNNNSVVRYNIYLLLFCLLSMISLFLLSLNIVDGVITFLNFIRPFILYFSISRLDFSEKDKEQFIKILTMIIIINLFIGYYQWFFIAIENDYIFGIVDDSHVFATLNYFVIGYLLINYILKKEKKSLFHLLLIIPVTLAAAGDKVTILFIPVVIFTLIYQKVIIIKPKTIILVSSTILLVVAIFITIFSQYRDEMVFRGLARFENVNQYGFSSYFYSSKLISTYTNLFYEYAKNIPSIILGSGLGNEYSSIAISKRTAVLGYDYQFLGTDIISYYSSLQALLLEFGFIATVIYFKIWQIIISKAKILCYARNNYNGILVASINYVILLFVLSTITQVERASLTVYLVIIIGVLIGKNSMVSTLSNVSFEKSNAYK